MYFNEKQSSTNIDSNFSSGAKLDKKKLTIIVATISCVLLIVIVILISSTFKKEVTFHLVLEGNSDIILFKDATYSEPGFKAYDSEGNDYTNQVIVNGDVDTSVVGDYIIKYSFNDIEKERIISIVHLNENMTFLSLKGDKIMYLAVGDEYVEPGFDVFDSVSNDLNNMVTVSNEVNTNVPGTYKVYYSLVNDLGVTLKDERTVIVYGADFNLFADTSKFVNDKVPINIIVTDNYFEKLVLPDGTFTTKRNHIYEVSENGEYKFVVYSKNNTTKEQSILIYNIDKIPPTVSCNATVKGNTSVTVNANDENGILGYEYILNGNSIGTSNSPVYNSKSLVNSVSVNVTDNAENSTLVNCKMEIIAPPSSSSSRSSSSGKTPNVNPVPVGKYIPCNGDRRKYNEHLLSLVSRYGRRKRATAVAIGKYISSEIEYKIPYFWAGGHWHFSWDGKQDTETFRGVSPQWGCITTNYREFNGTDQLPAGFDCTGFIAWVLFNTGFTKSEIGSWSGGTYLTRLAGKNLPVVDFKGSTGKIKAGDIVWREGHMGFIIGISGETVTIAHAKGTAYGLIVERYSSTTGKQIGGSASFSKVSILDNYYE